VNLIDIYPTDKKEKIRQIRLLNSKLNTNKNNSSDLFYFYPVFYYRLCQILFDRYIQSS
jgi:hypothetical protein